MRFFWLVLASARALVAPPASAARRRARLRRPATTATADATLPAPLATLCKALGGLPDDKYRYKQLLHWGATAPALDAALKVDANKVPGCLSTVHVHATLDADGRVLLFGDSDAQLTKGLVVLLVKGLSGATPAEVAGVDAAFIADAGVAASLTPGRNNGFVNMLATIKAKVAALGPAPPAGGAADGAAAAAGPVADAVRAALAPLKPSDVSVAAGTVRVVADCFAGLAPEKREALVRAVLGDAAGDADVAVDARTPDEA